MLPAEHAAPSGAPDEQTIDASTSLSLHTTGPLELVTTHNCDEPGPAGPAGPADALVQQGLLARLGPAPEHAATKRFGATILASESFMRSRQLEKRASSNARDEDQ